ncbi:hypothetical protein EPI10_024814 [Gossypium australe]|uniref:Uncharacterized protein n=1 Tax=Gossypium australe TaxID=47621 RepID=A0A5B6VY30_9ROSI|nr:hypothetical protein EPI10_024814 [Gossypium australe]
MDLMSVMVKEKGHLRNIVIDGEKRYSHLVVFPDGQCSYEMHPQVVPPTKRSNTSGSKMIRFTLIDPIMSNMIEPTK